MKLSVDYINKLASEDPRGFIAASEKEYYDDIYALANDIQKDEQNKIIMIAGPSSSGKTTSAMILCDYLCRLGKPTVVVSLDDFYRNRDEAPLDENGKRDLETVYALDLEEINRCFKEILEKGICDMPKFDFKVGKRSKERLTVDIRNGGLLIVEGLHALNPILSETLPKENIFKVYISISRAIYNEDNTVALSSRQMRLVRRISRDYIYRNSSAQNTFDMWESVMSGERKYLYEFKSTADRQIASLHTYEPCIFKKEVIRLLKEIDPKTEDYEYIVRTIRGLEQFVEISESLVPQESLVREFIRGGKYE